jgi:hypothetical protein
MKIVEFFLIIWWKRSELEPEPEFVKAGAGAVAGQKWTGSEHCKNYIQSKDIPGLIGVA